MQIRFTGKIVGGEHDGARVTFTGVAPADDWLDRAAIFRFDGHDYRIEEFSVNEETKEQIARLVFLK